VQSAAFSDCAELRRPRPALIVWTNRKSAVDSIDKPHRFHGKLQARVRLVPVAKVPASKPPHRCSTSERGHVPHPLAELRKG
jgi:hypothetical protein